nr:MAG TPA: Proprotein convertase subtilisin/kexin type 9 convertase, subtilisin, HYDROLASE.4A [Caudoviricetes sp.]
MKKIYAEWTLRGVFDNSFFNTWEEYFDFVFDPEIDVLLVKEV